MIDAIDTARLQLEPLVPAHAHALFAGLQHPDIYPFLDEGAPADLAALEARYRRLAARRSPDGRELWLNWAIRSHATAAYLGTVQATVWPDRTAEIAYVLIPSAWGHGHASEAVVAMIAALRADHQVATLVARIHPENRRSIALVTRLGFTRVPHHERLATPADLLDDLYRLRP